MTERSVFIADLEDGCPAAAGWVAYSTTSPSP